MIYQKGKEKYYIKLIILFIRQNSTILLIYQVSFALKYNDINIFLIKNIENITSLSYQKRQNFTFIRIKTIFIKLKQRVSKSAFRKGIQNSSATYSS